MAYRRANSGGRRSPLIPINRIPALPEPYSDSDLHREVEWGFSWLNADIVKTQKGTVGKNRPAPYRQEGVTGGTFCPIPIEA